MKLPSLLVELLLLAAIQATFAAGVWLAFSADLAAIAVTGG